MPELYRVKNRSQLIAGGWQEGRVFLLDLLEEALAAADPLAAAKGCLRMEDNDHLRAGEMVHLAEVGRTHFLGAGKATAPIAQAVEEVLGERLAGGVVVVRRGQRLNSRRLRVMEGDHPVPSRRSREAALATLQYAREQVRPGDLVLCGFTGGSSSLVSLPPKGVPFTAKVELHRMLLASGMPIQEINAVRKHVSAIKGGRLAHAMPTARIVNLTVSDVAEDPLDLITDPTVPDTSSQEDACHILKRYGLWDGVHPAVRRYLSRAHDPIRELPQVVQSLLLVTGTNLAQRLAEVAARRWPGLAVRVLTTSVEGEAREVGRVLAAYARERTRRGEAELAILAGGETTVTLAPERMGEGGPNLELALAFAVGVCGRPRVALLSVDTDGSDGSTAVAGGLVDGTTIRDLAAVREAVMSHHTLDLARRWQCAVETGQTGTNVNDLTLLLTA